MRRRPTLVPTPELLEERLAPIGFYQGPVPGSLMIALRGTVNGLATVASVASHGETIVRLGGAGRLAPAGWSTVAGTLIETNHTVRGSLVVSSSSTNLTIRLNGAVQPTGTIGTLSFVIADGKAGVPGTTFAYRSETGTGYATLELGAATGRSAMALSFRGL
jgi:hypothetical protein